MRLHLRVRNDARQSDQRREPRGALDVIRRGGVDVDGRDADSRRGVRLPLDVVARDALGVLASPPFPDGERQATEDVAAKILAAAT